MVKDNKINLKIYKIRYYKVYNVKISTSKKNK